MAEMSYLWDNPGTGDSPGGGYSQTEFMNEMFRMILNWKPGRALWLAE